GYKSSYSTTSCWDIEVFVARKRREDFFVFTKDLGSFMKNVFQRNRSVGPLLLVLAMISMNPVFVSAATRQGGEATRAALDFPVWSLIPFVLMLLSIAALPMAFPRWWDSNRNKTILSVAMS